MYCPGASPSGTAVIVMFAGEVPLFGVTESHDALDVAAKSTLLPLFVAIEIASEYPVAPPHAGWLLGYMSSVFDSVKAAEAVAMKPIGLLDSVRSLLLASLNGN